MNPVTLCVLAGLTSSVTGPAVGREGPPGVTSLTNPKQRFEETAVHQIKLKRGPVCVTVVDNAAVPPDHRAGYNGIASLTHEARGENLFVPAYAGLNLELIHNGTHVPRDRMMEPRRAPMRLRRIDAHTVELHQPPTPTWALESCTRFALLEDGAIEMTFECIPRKPVFKQPYIGLFWASYIRQPESKAIHFIGRPRNAPANVKSDWIEAVTPKHGVESTQSGTSTGATSNPRPTSPSITWSLATRNPSTPSRTTTASATESPWRSCSAGRTSSASPSRRPAAARTIPPGTSST